MMITAYKLRKNERKFSIKLHLLTVYLVNFQREHRYF